MDGSLFANPLVQSAVLPLLVAVVATALLRLVGGAGRGPLLAGAAIALGFLAAYLTIAGVPLWPPRASDQKLAYVVVAGVFLGLLLDIMRPPELWQRAGIVLAAAVAVLWLAEPRLRSPETAMLVRVALLWLGVSVALLRLSGMRARGSDAGATLLVVAAGLAPIAFFGASISVAQYAGALAAATGGFLLWSWPLSHYRFGQAGVLGAGGVLAAVVVIMALYTRASTMALALLLAAFFADLAARRVPLPGGTLKRLLGPISLALLGAVPVGLAVLVAYVAGGGSGSGGYY